MMMRGRSVKASMAAIIWVLGAAFPPGASADSAPEQEIRTLIARYRTAANARDLQGVMRCYAPDGVLVYDVSNAPFRGLAAVTRDWQQFITEMKAIKLEFRDVEVTVGPSSDFAYAHFIERASVTPKQGASIIADNLRTTHIYRKFEGRWLIVHEHKSKSRSD